MFWSELFSRSWAVRILSCIVLSYFKLPCIGNYFNSFGSKGIILLFIWKTIVLIEFHKTRTDFITSHRLQSWMLHQDLNYELFGHYITRTFAISLVDNILNYFWISFGIDS